VALLFLGEGGDPVGVLKRASRFSQGRSGIIVCVLKWAMQESGCAKTQIRREKAPRKGTLLYAR
jgi:hypothetical protein